MARTYTAEEVEQMKRPDLMRACNERYKDVQPAGNPWMTASVPEMKEALLLDEGLLPDRIKFQGPTAAQATNETATAAEHLSQALAILAQGQKATLDPEEIRAIVAEQVKAQVDKALADGTRTITVITPKRPEGKNMGLQHELFPVIMQHVQAGDNIWIVGPTGTGKTHTCHAVAEALELPFDSVSCGPTMTELAFLGFIDGHGNYHPTAFRKIFEHGGVFCLDEVDAASGDVMLVINAATSNGYMSFPDGLVKRHPDCIIIACANTYGTGATKEYSGRSQQDKALLQRFSQVFMDRDPKIEAELAKQQVAPEFAPLAAAWTKFVHIIRQLDKGGPIADNACPRAVYAGAKLLAQGLEIEHVIKARIFRGEAETAIQRVTSCTDYRLNLAKLEEAAKDAAKIRQALQKQAEQAQEEQQQAPQVITEQAQEEAPALEFTQEVA